jgi:phytoene dehydrogenase-like protein
VSTSPRIVVVGAGHNGLIAATRLARAGNRVVLLERAAQAGGAVKSGEVTLPGFHHDLYATNLNLFLGSAFYRDHRDALGARGLSFAHSDRPFANVFPDGRILRVYQGADRTLDELAAHNPADAEGWRALGHLHGRMVEAVGGLYASPLPSWASAGRLAKWALAEGRTAVPDLAQLLLGSTRELADRHLASPEAKALLACWGMHLDFAPDVAGGAVFPLLESFGNQANGMVVVKGGASRLVDALVGELEAAGGELRTGQEVTAFVTHRGRIKGVEVDGAERIPCEVVLASLDPRAALVDLLKGEDLPPAISHAAQRYRHGPASMVVHLALSGPIPWAAGEDLQRFAYVHIGPYVNDLARSYAAACAGELPRQPMLVVGQTSSVDATRAPAGQHVVWIQVRPVPSRITGDEALEINDTSWTGAAPRMAARVLSILESYAPGVGERILGQAISSPDDLFADNPNLVGGDSLGGSMHLSQTGPFRPFPGWSRYRTPIDGLYLCGASTWPGPGVHGWSGEHASSQVRADLARRRWATHVTRGGRRLVDGMVARRASPGRDSDR